MKHVMRLVVRLYPPEWRERYGQEFDALVEQLPGRWSDVANLVVEAIKMNLSTKKMSTLCAFCILAMALCWGASQTVGSRAAIRLAELALAALGQPVVSDGDLLQTATRQLTLKSVCNGPLGMLALSSLALRYLIFFERMMLLFLIIFQTNF